MQAFDFMQSVARSWGSKRIPSGSEPHFFEELYFERDYLLNSLQQQKHDATELLLRISSLEEKLLQDKFYYIHRKVKKQLGWLKRKVEETSRQEQIILARLRQVTSEIQSRERWTQIEQERRQQDFHQREQFFRFQQGLCHSIQYMQRLRLDPAQPKLHSQGYFPLYDQTPRTHWPQWQQQQHDPVNGCQAPATGYGYVRAVSAEIFRSGEVSPRSIIRSDYLARSNRAHRPDLPRRSASMDSAELELLSTNTALVQMPKLNRHSFPTLPRHSEIW